MRLSVLPLTRASRGAKDRTLSLVYLSIIYISYDCFSFRSFSLFAYLSFVSFCIFSFFFWDRTLHSEANKGTLTLRAVSQQGRNHLHIIKGFHYTLAALSSYGGVFDRVRVPLFATHRRNSGRTSIADGFFLRATRFAGSPDLRFWGLWRAVFCTRDNNNTLLLYYYYYYY